jgi:hypothetical protein
LVIKLTELPNLCHAHIGVANDIRISRIGIRETGSLTFTRGLHALADRLACLAQTIPAEFFIIHSWNFDVNVNSIEQRT